MDQIVALGHDLIDCGTPDERPIDFPDVTSAACELVLRGDADRVILVCGTGAGAVMAANKIPGIRAALGHDLYSARQCVEHDDANAMAIGAWIVGPAIVQSAIEAFLAATFGDTEDLQRRVRKLDDLDSLGGGVVPPPSTSPQTLRVDPV